MRTFKNILWGLVLIVLGILLGGKALGLWNINVFFKGWWTLFIIVPSFIGLFDEDDKTKIIYEGKKILIPDYIFTISK